MIGAERSHPSLGAAIDDRVLDLVRDDADAVIGDDSEPLGVEIGQCQVADLAVALQVAQVLEGVEIARVAVVPPMELQQIEAFDTHPRQRDPDRVFDDAPGHPSRIRHPLRERLDLGESLGAVAGGEAAAEVADKVLGRTIMVGEIPGGEPGVMMIGEHFVDGAAGVDHAMAAGDLPHAVQDPANRKIGGELEAVRCWERHIRYLRVAAVGFRANGK